MLSRFVSKDKSLEESEKAAQLYPFLWICWRERGRSQMVREIASSANRQLEGPPTPPMTETGCGRAANQRQGMSRLYQWQCTDDQPSSHTPKYKYDYKHKYKYKYK